MYKALIYWKGEYTREVDIYNDVDTLIYKGSSWCPDYTCLGVAIGEQIATALIKDTHKPKYRDLSCDIKFVCDNKPEFVAGLKLAIENQPEQIWAEYRD